MGNDAKVISGEAKGAKGIVLGHHGGSEHVMIDFPREVKEKLTYDDKIIVHGRGQGLKLLDYPDSAKINILPAQQIQKANNQVGYFDGEEDVREKWDDFFTEKPDFT